MSWSIDARIPLRFGTLQDVQAADAVLMEADALPPGIAGEVFQVTAADHVADCACCVARGSAAVALDRLFQRRVRGQTPFFRRVVAVTVSAEGDLAVWSALRNDPPASARYKAEPSSGTS